MRGARTGLFVAAVLIATAILVTLGFWQWQRRSEKAAFIAAIEAAAVAAPRSIGEARPWDRVALTGRYHPEKVAYVRSSRPAPKPGERDLRGNVPVSGFGVWVLQAFETERCTGGSCVAEFVLVSRGFLPTPPNGAIPPYGTPTGPVTITGFLRPSERAGWFPPQNDPERGVFFFRTSGEIATYLRLGDRVAGQTPAALSSFIDRQAEPGESAPPFGVEAAEFLRAIPNNHLHYAITWWSLAATNLVVAGLFLVSRRKNAQPLR